MSDDCQYPLIRAESRDDDIRTHLGDEYSWVGGYLDGNGVLLDGEQRELISIYEDFMVAFLDSSQPPLVGEDNRLRARDFVSPVRDTVIARSELLLLLEKTNAQGEAFAGRIAALPADQRDALYTLMAGAANGLADQEEGTFSRYALPEFDGMYNARMRAAVAQVNANEIMVNVLGGGFVGAVNNMNNMCATPTSPPPIPQCSKEEEGMLLF